MCHINHRHCYGWLLARLDSFFGFLKSREWGKNLQETTVKPATATATTLAKQNQKCETVFLSVFFSLCIRVSALACLNSWAIHMMWAIFFECVCFWICLDFFSFIKCVLYWSNLYAKRNTVIIWIAYTSALKSCKRNDVHCSWKANLLSFRFGLHHFVFLWNVWHNALHRCKYHYYYHRDFVCVLYLYIRSIRSCFSQSLFSSCVHEVKRQCTT